LQTKVGRTTNMTRCAWVEETNRRGRIVEVMISTTVREGGAKGQGVGDLQEDGLRELDAAVNDFIRFPDLGTKSRYA